MVQGGIYLFLGSDRSRKRERLTQLTELLGINLLDRHDISAHGVSPSHLLALAREHPVASPVRLVVVDDAQRLDGACVTALTKQLELLTQVACLVLLVDGDLPTTHPLAALTTQVVVERFDRPSPEPNRFAFVNAIARRDVGAALQAVQEHLTSGKEIVELLGLLVWQLQRWLTVNHLLEAGLAPERVEALTGLRAWQLQRTSAELAGRPTAVLRQILRRCWELDVAAKTGRTIPRMALEGLVVELCLPRPLPQERGRARAVA